jgi:hypothetical protein
MLRLYFLVEFCFIITSNEHKFPEYIYEAKTST